MSETDREPLGEDVSAHTMLGFFKHDDGRFCAYHSRLGSWTCDGTKRCLRGDHPFGNHHAATPAPTSDGAA